jgi:THO complex subunit 7
MRLNLALDAIIHSRITNDERALRRVVKKFNNYTAAAYSQVDTAGSDQSSSAAEDAREAFLVELSTFSLQLKKAVMVCEAEARQVEEYYRERQRIGKWFTPIA